MKKTIFYATIELVFELICVVLLVLNKNPDSQPLNYLREKSSNLENVIINNDVFQYLRMQYKKNVWYKKSIFFCTIFLCTRGGNTAKHILVLGILLPSAAAAAAVATTIRDNNNSSNS